MEELVQLARDLRVTITITSRLCIVVSRKDNKIVFKGEVEGLDLKKQLEFLEHRLVIGG